MTKVRKLLMKTGIDVIPEIEYNAFYRLIFEIRNIITIYAYLKRQYRSIKK